MNRIRQFLCMLLMLTMAIGTTSAGFCKSEQSVDQVVSKTAAYLVKTVEKPELGSIGGEWTVLGLARAEAKVPKHYYDAYYQRVVKTVKESAGILHKKKYTEYSRVILSLTAIGKDPSNVGGFNLLMPLGDFEATIKQGINGPIFALLALDSKGYKIPNNKEARTQATRAMYIEEILSRQLEDGGFALTGKNADPDVTAMALQALAKYKHQKQVKAAIAKGLNCLSQLQEADGGFSSWQTKNVESAAQVLVALSELGISTKDKRFIKNGNSVVDNIMSYQAANGFLHTKEGSGENLMATEQAFYALVSHKRVENGKSPLYTMSKGDRK